MLRKRRGFTLVEMLVAMALSLIIILAVTQVFRLVGDNVLAGRAVLEMSGQLRSASDQLQRDLGGLTVPVRPWPETGAGAGYFEYYEGPFWDMGLGLAAAGPEPDPRNPYPRPVPKYAESSVGDIDDVLMFTVYATGAPFVGQIMGTIDSNMAVHYDPAVRTSIESRVAEVVWFTRFNDRLNLNPDPSNDTLPRPDPGEVTLHRRVFLVRPDLDLSDPGIQALPPGFYYSGFDLSTRAQIDPISGNFAKVANSLETLALRENRIAHNVLGGYPVAATDPLIVQPFPHEFSRALLVPQGSVVTKGQDGEWGVRVDDDSILPLNDVREAGYFGSDDLTLPIDEVFPLLPHATKFAESFGSDMILSNVLAFDVQAYDPSVPVFQAMLGSEAVLPSDPGYAAAAAADVLLGNGGYVDLFYGRYLTTLPFPARFLGPPLFADRPLLKSGMQDNPLRNIPPVFWGQSCYPAVYDTWSMFYEHDGIDQDGVYGADQGTNGIDDDGINGVDDVGERETSPPYPVPLRGIQVRLRIIDRDTRQVRQMTVSSDFIPE